MLLSLLNTIEASYPAPFNVLCRPSALAFKEKVDYVKKNSDNMKIITKVSKSLDKLSDMISYYITKTFNTKSYIENKSDFYYCLWVLDRLNELMGTLAPKEPIKK